VFEIVPGVVLVSLAYIYRSIWSLVFGLLISSAVQMITTYFLLNDIRVRFRIVSEYVRRIIHFGKWIFLSSADYFLSSNLDRLYLGKVGSLSMLGSLRLRTKLLRERIAEMNVTEKLCMEWH
jgi:O-antigen/teichoic acid export membrane protein